MAQNNAQSKTTRRAKKSSSVISSARAKRSSLAKSLGKLHKDKHGENPVVAIQQINLFQKQRAFITGQADAFAKRSQTLKEQADELGYKIREQKTRALKMVKNLEKEPDEMPVDTNKRRAKPGNTSVQKTKKFIKLGY
jgi:hypothetical protein